MKKIKYTQVELPSLHLNWKRKNGEEIISSAIRTNYPKPSLCFIPPIAEQGGCEVEAIDMKIRDQDTIIPYREFEYGDGTMVASRMGMPFEKLENKLKETDILGISINPSSWSNIAIDFMRYAKKVNPKIKTIIGGNEAIFRTEYYLKDGLADIAVTGEAENILPDLIKSFSKDENSLGDVNGIAYKTGNKIVRTQNAPKPKMNDIPLQNFDILKDDISLWTTPIEYWKLPNGAKSPIGWLFMTRGCFQNCEYCTTPKKMGKFRFRSLENIEKELDHFKEHGINTINIWDDSLSSVMYPMALGKEKGREYIMNIAKMLKEKGFAYELSQGGLLIKDLWDKNANEPDFELINNFFSNKIVNDKFVGFYGQYFPTECLQIENPHERYHKLMTFDKEKQILEAILDAGEIKPSISYSSLIGNMEDTKNGFYLALKRFKELNNIVKSKGGKPLVTPFIHSIFPGTRLWDNYVDNLVYSIEEFPELYQFQTAPHRTINFEPHEITLEKKKMEKELFTPKQYENWNKTGRYQWE